MDPNFHQTVTYICEHNEQGAMGIIINQPLDIELGEVLEHMEMKDADEQTGHQPVYLGGPVQPERGFVLHHPLGQWDSMLAVTDDIGVTTSRDILQALHDGKGPEQSLVALGYAGWAAGQLENELADNAWLTHPADSDILFSTPSDQLWEAAANAIGFDMSLISHDAGHA